MCVQPSPDVPVRLLSRYDIPLVILEACRSGQIDAVALRSVAPRLIDAGVGSVIAMTRSVSFEGALFRRVARCAIRIGSGIDCRLR